ncbi:Palmitoyltransferase [Spironucleus salmonicida]|uniref:Palmitoyltransferase n=1 Tax=Spironucleus salmonicida TaxID=348837 RepID=V6M042_9EUKA|nr:Palmitoyltransferase [Spironucleus salmonicida]|eukprot:EST46494.1 DHHC zinc finger and transmembrane domain-containing protein [Spironucleus salmonicida]
MDISPLKAFPFVFNLSALFICLYHGKPLQRIFITATYSITTFYHIKIVTFQPRITLNTTLTQSKYCPHCNLTVPQQSKHSQRAGYCIARYDHFCVLFQIPIGQKNVLLYLTMQILEICYTIQLLIVLSNAMMSKNECGPGEVVHVVLSIVVLLGVSMTFLQLVAYTVKGTTQYESKNGKKK